MTPKTHISHATGHEATQIPGVAINNAAGGTIQVFIGNSNGDKPSAVRDFIAPDAASHRFNQQIAAMQALKMIPETTALAVDHARQEAGIEMPPLGTHAQQIHDQQIAALSASQGMEKS